MRFISGIRAAAITGAAVAILVVGDASAQSLPAGVGVGAFGSTGGAPVSGPVGARAFFGGGVPGGGFGFLGGFGGYGGYGGFGDDVNIMRGGNATAYNYSYTDVNRYGGGYYGGGGVFYGDDGYSRLYVYRPSAYERGYGGYPPTVRAGREPAPGYGRSQHVYYLPTTHYRPGEKQCHCEKKK